MTASVLRTPDAAKYIGISPSTLTKMRLRGGDTPPFVQLGSRSIGYRVVDLDSWIEARRRSAVGEVY